MIRPGKAHDGDLESGAMLFLNAKRSEKPEDLEAVEQWIGADSDRRRCIEDIGRLWDGIGEIAEFPEVETWRTQAIDAGPSRRFSSSAARPYLALAASFLLTVSVGTALWRYSSQVPQAEQQLASAIGKRRQLILSDGTGITLDAASRVAVRYSSDIRIVRVLSGQARFRVAHDPTRPFHVEVAGDDVQALGTDFNVATTLSSSAVSLIEGSVLISRLQHRTTLFGLRQDVVRVPTVTLRPGQQFERTGDARPRLRRFDPLLVTAWQEGRIVFEDLPLPDAVALANRYSQRTIVMDPQVPPIRFTAVVNAGDGMAFAQTVTSYLPGTYLQVSSTRIVIRKGREDISSIGQ